MQTETIQISEAVTVIAEHWSAAQPHRHTNSISSCEQQATSMIVGTSVDPATVRTAQTPVRTKPAKFPDNQVVKHG